MRLAPLALVTLSCALCWPVTASAYCRTTTTKLTRQDILDERCPGGLPVFWNDLTIHYGFDPSRASHDLDQDEVSAVFAEAFAQWAAVECEDSSTGFEFIEDQEPYDEPNPRHVLKEKNVNAMLFRPAAEWTLEDNYPPEAFALTTAWMDLNTGEMLGADMEINEAMGPYARCPDTGCPPGVTDLGNVVTHETGHVLGLGESYVTDATMFWQGRSGDLNKRDLAEDDVAGLCAAYSPSAQLEREEQMKDDDEGGCAIAPGRRASEAGLWLLAMGAFVLTRRFRPRTP